MPIHVQHDVLFKPDPTCVNIPENGIINMQCRCTCCSLVATDKAQAQAQGLNDHLQIVHLKFQLQPRREARQKLWLRMVLMRVLHTMVNAGRFQAATSRPHRLPCRRLLMPLRFVLTVPPFLSTIFGCWGAAASSPMYTFSCVHFFVLRLNGHSGSCYS